MLGCDIVKVSRFKKNLSKLANKILSESEIIEFNKTTNKIQYIAGRWAAKEAIFKATGNRKMTILNSTTGSPYVVNNSNIKIIISHEKENAIAVA